MWTTMRLVAITIKMNDNEIQLTYGSDQIYEYLQIMYCEISQRTVLI
jgi:hypothetical protein